jgi:hypothetical protein
MGRYPGIWISVRFSFLGPVEKQRRNNTNVGIMKNKMTNDYKEIVLNVNAIYRFNILFKNLYLYRFSY